MVPAGCLWPNAEERSRLCSPGRVSLEAFSAVLLLLLPPLSSLFPPTPDGLRCSLCPCAQHYKLQQSGALEADRWRAQGRGLRFCRDFLLAPPEVSAEALRVAGGQIRCKGTDLALKPGPGWAVTGARGVRFLLLSQDCPGKASARATGCWGAVPALRQLLGVPRALCVCILPVHGAPT